jgi:hypothetical protein
MKHTFVLTLDDYEAALRLHRRQKLSRQCNFYFWYVAVPILTLVAAIASFAAIVSGRHDLLENLVVPDAALLWLTISLPVVRAYKIHKSFERIFLSAQQDEKLSIDIDNERILSEIPGVGEGKYLWTTIIGFAQDERMTLLYVYKDRFLLFPTAVFSPEQRTELSDIVARNMVRKPI